MPKTPKFYDSALFYGNNSKKVTAKIEGQPKDGDSVTIGGKTIKYIIKAEGCDCFLCKALEATEGELTDEVILQFAAKQAVAQLAANQMTDFYKASFWKKSFFSKSTEGAHIYLNSEEEIQNYADSLIAERSVPGLSCAVKYSYSQMCFCYRFHVYRQDV